MKNLLEFKLDRNYALALSIFFLNFPVWGGLLLLLF